MKAQTMVFVGIIGPLLYWGTTSDMVGVFVCLNMLGGAFFMRLACRIDEGKGR